MPRNWALVGIGVHNFGQRFTPREITICYLCSADWSKEYHVSRCQCIRRL